MNDSLSGALMTAIINAPVCAVDPTDDDVLTVHAVTMRGLCAATIGFELRPECSLRPVKLLGIPIGSEDVVPWPLSTRGLPSYFARCRACWEITGKKHPRARLAERGDAMDP